MGESTPANLCLSMAVAVVLALGVARITIASCGSPTTDAPQIISTSPPDDSPADVMPTPATAGPTPAESARATIPVWEEVDLLGKWANYEDSALELVGNGVYTLSHGSGQPDTGTWSLQENGSIVLEGQSYAAIPHGNLLLLGGTDATFTLDILQRVDDDGNLLAYEPASAIEVPPIDPSAILTITIGDHWTGLSPLAPIEAQFRLVPTTDHFSGIAEFSVAGYTEAITRSVPISVPLAVIGAIRCAGEDPPGGRGVPACVQSH